LLEVGAINFKDIVISQSVPKHCTKKEVDAFHQNGKYVNLFL